MNTVDEYIASLPPAVRVTLEQIRAIIKKAAPKAQESIAYRMPAYKLNGKPLVYFAAFNNHIGFYPLPDVINIFKSDLSKYKHAKGSF